MKPISHIFERRQGIGWSLSWLKAAGSLCALMLMTLSVYAGGVAVADRAYASATAGILQPAAGQFTPIAPVEVLSTQDGTGGVPVSPLAANATVTFPVEGVGVIPGSYVSDAYVVITALNPSQPGAIEDFDPDNGNPGIWVAPFAAGQDVSVSDLVQVSDAGTVSVTNASSGSADVVVTVIGYVQAEDSQVSGDTYVGLPYGGVLDTRSGYGAPQAQIPAGGSLTFQVSGEAGVPSDADGAALYLGVANASAPGFISAFPAGGTDPGEPIVSYSAGSIVRNLYFGQLPSSGELTLVNHGTAPVDLMAAVQGYLVSPAASEAGATYIDVTPGRIADTRSGTGGVPATPVPAGGSITFAATGVDGVPASGASSVVEGVAALNPTAKGYLSVYPGNGTDPNNSDVNFNAGDGQDNDLSAPLVSSVSPTGQETITNHSSGTVDVVVSLRGYYAAPAVPQAPDSVSASISGASATISWDPPYSDGGAAITSYTITASPDTATATVNGATTQETLTGLANAATDLFTVTATNVIGTGLPTTYSPPNVITGTIVAPNAAATPVAGDQVSIFPNAEPASGTPSIIGTATTDANGNWSFAVPPYADLPADAQASADGNDGFLDVDAVAMGTATANGDAYQVGAIAVRSAWVGSSTQTTAPSGISSLAEPVSVMHPNQPDVSSNDNQVTQAATWATENSPVTTDADDDALGDPNNAYPPVRTDAYGYQEIAGNGSYNPNIASDGTDLTNAPVTPQSNPRNCCNPYGCTYTETNSDIGDSASWTIIGQYDNNWADQGWFTYTAGASSNIGSAVSIDGGDFNFGGFDNYTTANGFSQEEGNDGPYESHQVAIYMSYRESSNKAFKNNSRGGSTGTLCYNFDQWDRHGITKSPDGHYIELWHKIWIPQNQVGKQWKTDGCTAFGNATGHIPGTWWYDEAWPYEMQITRSAGITYGFAADVAGIGIRAETDHTTASETAIQYNEANSEPPDTRTDPEYGGSTTNHFFWGSDGPVDPNGGPQPAAVYNC
jgi:fibronectin type III domain protein